MPPIRDQLGYLLSVANFFLSEAERCVRDERLNEALLNTYVAATILSTQNCHLSSTRLELILQAVARGIGDDDHVRSDTVVDLDSRKRVLHVMSEALPAGGVTAMATRWIQLDDRSTHHLAILSSELQVPAELEQAVGERGGGVSQAKPGVNLVEQARWLRLMARQHADLVVLHVDTADVVCGAAFGKDGGPPVLIVNHTAHSFWVGATIADCVVNCRGSELEVDWSSRLRGAVRCGTVPIPLAPVDPAEFTNDLGTNRKQAAKQRLGLAPSAVVILTVGAWFKYLPANDVDFVQIIGRILAQVPEGVLIVAGFEPDQRWKNASRAAGGRIRVLGRLSREQLERVHEATDLYVEGFPFGTTTSLLEAGLRGIPVVLSPSACPPPFGTDGLAVDCILGRAVSPQEYESTVVRLCHEPEERRRLGQLARESIERHHTGEGWKTHLQSVLKSVPAEHAVSAFLDSIETPENIFRYWREFVEQIGPRSHEILEESYLRAMHVGLCPRLSREVIAEYASARQGMGKRILLPALLRFLSHHILPRISLKAAAIIFRCFYLLSRENTTERVLRKIAYLLGFERKRGAYTEYRTAAKSVR